MDFSLSTLLISGGLLLIQAVLALPWIAVAFSPPGDIRLPGGKGWRGMLVGPIGGVTLLVCLVTPVLFFLLVQDKSSLEITGRTYAAFLQIQLTVDLFILLFVVLLQTLPKSSAVALAAFREGIRQWPYWAITITAALLMTISIFVPYFTFGEDYLMVKQLGYDTIMLAAVLFGGLEACMSITEEIEGRSAITVMSKPVSRRQFMLGKYLGIVLACLFMLGLLAVYFEGTLMVKHWFEKLESISEQRKESSVDPFMGVVHTPAWVNEFLQRWKLPEDLTNFLRGIGQWVAHTLDTLPGLVLCFSQVMVLVALAVALATRLPMVVNLTTVLVVYFLAHLTPVLVSIAGKAKAAQPNSPVPRLLGFVAQVFDTVLPDLGMFRMDPALLSDAPPAATQFAKYVGSVTVYGVIYSAIVLLFGLILFEDRDLA